MRCLGAGCIEISANRGKVEVGVFLERCEMETIEFCLMELRIASGLVMVR